MSEPSKTPEAATMPVATPEPSSAEVDVLIVGAGVTGIYQLHLAREAGFSVQILEAGNGVGGTWFWNRYPEARFDSESYSYGFLFSEELWQEWEWTEKYAGQPEVERYFNYVVDRFDMRRHIAFGAKVNAVVLDEATGTYSVGTESGDTYRARYVIAASGNLSVPFIPAIEGRDVFGGQQVHTGRWPSEPIDFHGKRVAQIGTGSSGVQIVPAIADDVAKLTVFQMKADWVTPLNNGPTTPEQQARLKAGFAEISQILNTSPSGFDHSMDFRTSDQDDPEKWPAVFQQMWDSGGFRKLTEGYVDLTLNPVVNQEWCAFIAAKVRDIVEDPATADKLIPKDSGYGGRRPPFGTGYYEAFNNPHVELVSLPESPIVRITETGIETSEGHQEFDIIIWATGWDFGTGALNRLGVVGRDGVKLEDYWAQGPKSYLGVASVGFPNFFYPGGPHGATGNNPRYAGDQAEITMDVIVHARDSGRDIVEVTSEAETVFTRSINESGSQSSFLESSYFYGGNIPGKPVAQLLNPTGRWTLHQLMAEARESDFATFEFRSAAAPEAGV